jgi:Immunity protein Imm1
MTSTPPIDAGRQPGASNTSPLPTLQCSDAEPPATIRTCLELDGALHKAELRCAVGRPIIVSLYTRGFHLEIGLGLPRSFVSIQRCEPQLGQRVITVGDGMSDSGAVFFLGGDHTEVSRRNLLPASDARRIFREFFNTGVASTSCYWEAL